MCLIAAALTASPHIESTGPPGPARPSLLELFHKPPLEGTLMALSMGSRIHRVRRSLAMTLLSCSRLILLSRLICDTNFDEEAPIKVRPRHQRNRISHVLL